MSSTEQHRRAQSIQISKSGALSQDTPKAGGRSTDVHVSKAVAGSLFDFALILSLVLGGCCSNVWSYEHLLKLDSHLGTTLTFSQMCFITLHSLPSFLRWDQQTYTPRLQRRHIPLRQWIAQVLVLTSSSLLNNWAYAYQVPLTVQIVFRSAGLAVSMLFGYLFWKRRYTLPQITAVVFVSAGVVLATLSRPSSPSPGSSDSPPDFSKYTLGIVMMTVSLFLTGILGMLQERTYSTYGPYWKEGVFYTHLLSLPIFVFLIPDIRHGFQSLSSHTAPVVPTPISVTSLLTTYAPYFVLAANLITQLMCVSAVNQLTSRVSSVSTNLVLTTRKAISLCFSVWWFGNGWNAQLGLGAGMVFAGSLLYTLVNSGSKSHSSTESPSGGIPQKTRKKIE
ncbi:uncharacterized protein FIBRA_04652 [Fibroporia radiculosa]|uniref:Sugar phosphate transporter domain-containing protein n=1 Tax=Fibroporia radiculosa TaxID=599839 RepID=J4H328_9APHY|nr:uncharacterized protein FIBRA_04652 [Fibroporia radiculosa]CCM02549.1 predicted protein [Fibroporia radiculosa]